MVSFRIGMFVDVIPMKGILTARVFRTLLLVYCNMLVLVGKLR